MRGRPEVALLLDGGEVLLSARVAPLLLDALHAYRRARRDAGLGLPPVAVELGDLLTAAVQGSVERARAARTAVSTAAEVDSRAARAGSGVPVELVDPVTAREAARMLGTGERNVRDLCRRRSLLTARPVGGRWMIERAEVLDRRSA